MKRILKRVMCYALALMVFFVNVGCKNAYSDTVSTKRSLEAVDMTDIDNWKSGSYGWSTGKYEVYPQRICLKEYVTVTSEKYNVVIENPDYQLLVREMDGSDAVITTVKLNNGDTYVPSEDTTYIGVTLYNPKNEWGTNYQKYKDMFADGVKFQLSAEIKVDEPQSGEEIGETDSLGVDLENLDNWKSGSYSWEDGKYVSYYSQRICLKDYVVCSGGTYNVVIGNDEYKLVLRELDGNKTLIASAVLANGDIYTPSENVKYLAITLYNAKNEWSVNYATYKNLFSQGLIIKLSAVTTDEPAEVLPDDEPQFEDTDIEMCDLTDINNWRTGTYTWSDGTYASYSSRICLKDYKTFKSASFQILISDTAYKVLVRELDKNKKFIQSVTLADGDTYIPSAGTAFLGISLYNSENEWSVSFNSYKNMIGNTLNVEMKAGTAEVPEQTETPSKGDDVQTTPIEPVPDQNTGYQSFREELKAMLETGDMTEHNVSKYNMNFSTYYDTYTDLIQGECYLAYQSTLDVIISSTKDANGVIQTIKLDNMDADFSNRYTLVKQSVNEVKAMIQPEMTDLEKALIIHDYIVENTVYENGVGASNASGPLAYGKAICGGYSAAMITLLHEEGIEAYLLTSSSLNHGWVMVNIDGKYYHIDPTWDDTRKSITNKTNHDYFIRNDIEFRNVCASAHYGWVSYEANNASTSTMYENWFVHDVNGKILYLDGYWYYADGNHLMRAHIDGSDMSVVAAEESTVDLTSIENGTVYYNVNGIEKTIQP